MSDWNSYNNNKEIELRNKLTAFVLGSGVGFLYTIERRNEQNETVNTAGPTEIDISNNKNGNNIPYVMGILESYFTDPGIMVGWEAKYDSEHNNTVHVRIIQQHPGSTGRN